MIFLHCGWGKECEVVSYTYLGEYKYLMGGPAISKFLRKFLA